MIANGLDNSEALGHGTETGLGLGSVSNECKPDLVVSTVSRHGFLLNCKSILYYHDKREASMALFW